MTAITTHESNVTCNLCGGTNTRPMREHPDRGCTFVECQGCGLMYYSPRLREDYVVQTYLRAGDAKAEAESMLEKGVFFGEPQGSPQEQIASLKQYYAGMLAEHVGLFEKINGRRPTSIFEAGTSVGWHLSVAAEMVRQVDPSAAVAGCDANTFAAQLARDALKLDVSDDLLSRYPLRPENIGRYDLIAAYDYIEHSYTPADDLRKLFLMAAPGAVLALKTFLHELDKDEAYVHPVFHHHHFTTATLRRAVEQAGWRILVFDDERERVYAQATVYAAKPNQ